MLTIRMNWTKWCIWFLLAAFTVAVTLKIKHALDEVSSIAPATVTPKPMEKTE